MFLDWVIFCCNWIILNITIGPDTLSHETKRTRRRRRQMKQTTAHSKRLQKSIKMVYYFSKKLKSVFLFCFHSSLVCRSYPPIQPFCSAYCSILSYVSLAFSLSLSPCRILYRFRWHVNNDVCMCVQFVHPPSHDRDSDGSARFFFLSLLVVSSGFVWCL